MTWIDKIPLLPLVLVGVFLFLAPFVPEPHLFEKVKMLAAGELTKPLDVLDLFWHGVPPILLLLRLYRQFVLKISV